MTGTISDPGLVPSPEVLSYPCSQAEVAVLPIQYGDTTRNCWSRLYGFATSNDERKDSDRDAETISLADVLGVLETVAGPVVTSGDGAETLECSREAARQTLRTLEADGHVANRNTAGRVVWWVRNDHEPVHGVDPDDPFWEFEPGASGESDVSETVDEILYGTKSA